MSPRHPLQRPLSPEHYDRKYFLHHCGGHEIYAESRGMRLDARLSVILQMAKIQPGMFVLDLGCGRGELVLHVAHSGALIWGVDLSPEAIQISRETLHLASSKAKLRSGLLRATALRLPFPNKAFHRVLLSDILEHLLPEELERTLSEIHRVIRDDGWVTFHTFPNRWFYTLYYPLRRLLCDLPRRRAGPRDPRTPCEHAMHVNELSPLDIIKAFRPFFQVRLWCAHRDRWESSSGGFGKGKGPLDWFVAPEIWGIGRKRRIKMDGELKSTLDLVMEKLGRSEAGPALSDEQKGEIAEIRKRYEAKMAEARILLAGKEELPEEIARLERRMEEKIEGVRKAKAK